VLSGWNLCCRGKQLGCNGSLTEVPFERGEISRWEGCLGYIEIENEIFSIDILKEKVEKVSL
jgi:hypothetical protein